MPQRGVAWSRAWEVPGSVHRPVIAASCYLADPARWASRVEEAATRARGNKKSTTQEIGFSCQQKCGAEACGPDVQMCNVVMHRSFLGTCPQPQGQNQGSAF